MEQRIQGRLEVISSLAPFLHVDELRVLVALTVTALEDRSHEVSVWPREIAATTGLTASRVAQAIKGLASKRVVSIVKRAGATEKRYRLNCLRRLPEAR